MSGSQFRQVHLDHLSIMFDLVVGSLDYGSGWLSTEEMRTVDLIGQMIGAKRVRCREHSAKSDEVWPGQCVLPIGHESGHDYMGERCDNPHAPRYPKPAWRTWADNHVAILDAALRSGVRPLTEKML